eukprot:gene133-biopygen3056
MGLRREGGRPLRGSTGTPIGGHTCSCCTTPAPHRGGAATIWHEWRGRGAGMARAWRWHVLFPQVQDLRILDAPLHTTAGIPLRPGVYR